MVSALSGSEVALAAQHVLDAAGDNDALELWGDGVVQQGRSACCVAYRTRGPIDLGDVALFEDASSTPGHGNEGRPELMQLRSPRPLKDSATMPAIPRPWKIEPILRAEPTPKLRPTTSTSPGATSSDPAGPVRREAVLELLLDGHEYSEVRDHEIGVDVVTELPDLARESVRHCDLLPTDLSDR